MSSERYVLDLYLAGDSSRSRSARATLERIAERLGERCTLTVIDVFERPDLAEGEGVIVTPTLLRASPEPPLRLEGNLSQEEQVLAELGIARSNRVAPGP